MEITRRIYLDKIKNNLSACKSKVMLMIKADAYGHGAVEVASALKNDVDYFGVATVGEGCKVRENGVKTPILCVDVLPCEFSTATKYDLSVSVGDMKSLAYLASIPPAHRPKIHLKLNTGMNRFGFSKDELESALSLAVENEIDVDGAYTHLYAPNETQLDLFDEEIVTVKKFYPSVLTHACSSSSLSLNRYDMVRVGIGAYENTARVESVVLNSLKIGKGDRVGYGDNFADSDGYAVWISGGYADGIVRSQPVLVDGMIFSAVSVCMDVFAVLSTVPIEKGEKAILIGDTLTEKVVANMTNRSVYEVMTALKGRVKNVYDESGSKKNRKSKYSKNDGCRARLGERCDY